MPLPIVLMVSKSPNNLNFIKGLGVIQWHDERLQWSVSHNHNVHVPGMNTQAHEHAEWTTATWNITLWMVSLKLINAKGNMTLRGFWREAYKRGTNKLFICSNVQRMWYYVLSGNYFDALIKTQLRRNNTNWKWNSCNNGTRGKCGSTAAVTALSPHASSTALPPGCNYRLLVSVLGLFYWEL